MLLTALANVVFKALIGSLFAAVFLRAAIAAVNSMRGEETVKEGTYEQAYMTCLVSTLVIGLVSFVVWFAIVVATNSFLGLAANIVGLLIGLTVTPALIASRHSTSFGNGLLTTAVYFGICLLVGLVIFGVGYLVME